MLKALWIFIISGLVTLEKLKVIDCRADPDQPVPPEI